MPGDESARRDMSGPPNSEPTESDPGRGGGNDGRQRFGYFVLQTRRDDGLGPETFHLSLENLGTGEKVTFTTSTALARYLDAWGGKAAGDARFMAPSPTEST